MPDVWPSAKRRSRSARATPRRRSGATYSSSTNSTTPPCSMLAMRLARQAPMTRAPSRDEQRGADLAQEGLRAGKHIASATKGYNFFNQSTAYFVDVAGNPHVLILGARPSTAARLMWRCGTSTDRAAGQLKRPGETSKPALRLRLARPQAGHPRSHLGAPGGTPRRRIPRSTRTHSELRRSVRRRGSARRNRRGAVREGHQVQSGCPAAVRPAAGAPRGKVVYMAVPRLRQARCFWELDPRRLRDPPAAASIGGAAKAGRAVDPRALPHIDLVVAGSVAVSRT